LAAVLATQAIYDGFLDDSRERGFLHSHSYTGNALACRAALAVLDIFAEDDVLAQNRAKAAAFAPLLAPLQAHPAVRHFRQQGMIWAFDVATTRSDFALAFFSAMLEQGCLLRPIGQTVYFMPPYVIEAEQMAQLVNATLRTLDALVGDGDGQAGEQEPAVP